VGNLVLLHGQHSGIRFENYVLPHAQRQLWEGTIMTMTAFLDVNVARRATYSRLESCRRQAGLCAERR
jgi:hypothetical protein